MYSLQKMLSPAVIAKLYTAEQIDAKIALLQTAYENAAENQSYALDDIQSKQSVKTQDLDTLSTELNTWLKAKCLQSGESLTAFYSGNYTGHHN